MGRIKRNEKVLVIAGKDKGKTGKVLVVYPKANKAIVENINMVKKAKRKTQQDQQGGIIEIEQPIHLSNLSADTKKSKPAKAAKESKKKK